MTKDEIACYIHYPQDDPNFVIIGNMVDMFIETTKKMYTVRSKRQIEKYQSWHCALASAIMLLNKDDNDFIYDLWNDIRDKYQTIDSKEVQP